MPSSSSSDCAIGPVDLFEPAVARHRDRWFHSRWPRRAITCSIWDRYVQISASFASALTSALGDARSLAGGRVVVELNEFLAHQ